MNLTERLSPTLQQKATLRGKEYAWPVDVIPDVIAAAQQANLVNVGGTLQFRMPDATCECYWIEVDNYPDRIDKLPWQERVEKTAEYTLKEFKSLRDTKDFLAEGRKAFAKHIDAYLANGGELNDAMCFVWYLESEEQASGML